MLLKLNSDVAGRKIYGVTMLFDSFFMDSANSSKRVI